MNPTPSYSLPEAYPSSRYPSSKVVPIIMFLFESWHFKNNFISSPDIKFLEVVLFRPFLILQNNFHIC